MTGEELRERLMQGIIPAFDKWAAKNFDVLFNPETRKKNPEAYEEHRLASLFMTKRVYILGFFRYVTQQVVESEDLQRQRKTLVEACMLSILHPSGVSVRDLEGKPSEPDSRYTRKQLQRIMREDYQQTFFEIPVQRGMDGRVSPYSSVFSPYDVPSLVNPEMVKQFQAMDRALLESRRDLIEWIMTNNLISKVTPEYVTDLLSFRKQCSGILLKIGDHSEMGKVLSTELNELTEVLEVFHAHMLSIQSVEWFRSRQEQTKRALIHDGFPLKYTEEDATHARSLLLELTKSEDYVFNLMTVAARAFMEYRNFQAQTFLFDQCRKLPSLDILHKAILHENIAVLHREESKPKLMVQEMKTALDLYRQSGDKYRIAVALKNLGEAEWQLGFKELAIDYFKESETMSTSLESSEKAGVIRNLAVAARRIREKKMEIDYLVKLIKVAPAEWTELILQANIRLDELLDT